MKIVSWNVRGLGGPEKRRSVKSFFAINKVDIMLQENKMFFRLDWLYHF